MDKYRHPNSQRSGFTLIELLIVIIILGSVGTIVAIILINSLRASTKSNTYNIIKNNGDFALNQMVENIRYATSVTCQSLPSPSPQVTITSPNGVQMVYTCSGTTLTSQVINAGITPTPSSLLDTNTVAVVASSCNFICSILPNSSTPYIQINFSLQPTNTNNLQEQTAPTQEFSSAVTLRNVNR